MQIALTERDYRFWGTASERKTDRRERKGGSRRGESPPGQLSPSQRPVHVKIDESSQSVYRCRFPGQSIMRLSAGSRDCIMDARGPASVNHPPRGFRNLGLVQTEGNCPQAVRHQLDELLEDCSLKQYIVFTLQLAS